MSAKPAEGAAEAGTAVPSAAPEEISLRRRGPVRLFLQRHPLVTDMLVGGAYLVATLTDVLLAPRTYPQLNAPVILPSLLGAAVLLVLLRRRRPILLVALLSLVDPLILRFSGGLFSLGFGVLLGMYSVGLKYRPAVVFGVLAVATVPPAVAFMVLGYQITEGRPEVFWVALPMMPMMYVISAGLGISVRRNRLHEDQVRAWARRSAELASVAERSRIAREMHDVVAHSLTVMVALSEGAEVALRRNPVRAGEALTELSATGRAALADMRRVLGILRRDSGPASRDPVVPGSLEALVDGFVAAGLPATLTRSGPPLPEDPGFLLTVHRMVQEALTNALRYAPGSPRVEVLVRRGTDGVRLSVTDDGGGLAGMPAPALGSGRGLQGMRERAAIYGGTVQAGPLPGGGWRTTAVLPLPDGADAGLTAAEAGHGAEQGEGPNG